MADETVRQIETESAQIHHIVHVELQLQPLALRRGDRLAETFAAPGATRRQRRLAAGSRRIHLRHVTASTLNPAVRTSHQLTDRKEFPADLQCFKIQENILVYHIKFNF